MKAILLIEHKVFSVIFTCNQFSCWGKKCYFEGSKFNGLGFAPTKAT